LKEIKKKKETSRVKEKALLRCLEELEIMHISWSFEIHEFEGNFQYR